VGINTAHNQGAADAVDEVIPHSKGPTIPKKRQPTTQRKMMLVLYKL